jgi:hypothetical protein
MSLLGPWRDLGGGEVQIRGEPATNPSQQDLWVMDVFLQLRRRMRHPPPRWYADTAVEHLHIAVHVRRGDLITHSHWASGGRWWPDRYYQDVLPALFQAVTARGIPFTCHVFSDGNGWDAAQLSWKSWWQLHGMGSHELRFHIGEDLFETQAHLADADVLVSGGSSFSLSVANYNLGLLVAHRGWSHDPTLWCGGFCDSGLSARDQLRVFPLPPQPLCTCMSTGMRASVIQQMLLNNSNDAHQWRARLGVSAHELQHGSFPRSQYGNCTEVCARGVQSGYADFAFFRNSTVDRMGDAAQSLLRWKAEQSQKLERNNWTSVASLFFQNHIEMKEKEEHILSKA